MNPQKVLVIAPDHIGDFLLCTPAIRAVRKGLNNAEITVVLSSINKEAASGNPDIDDVIVFDKKKDAKEKFAGKKYDLTICLPANVEKYFLASASKSPRRVGYYYTNMWIGRILSLFLLTDRIACEDDPARITRNPEKVKHELEQYLEVAKYLGLPSEEKEMVLVLDEGYKEYAASFFNREGLQPGRTIGVHFSGKWFYNSGRKKFFIQLLNVLKEKFSGNSFLVAGSAREEAAISEIIKSAPAGTAKLTASSLKSWAACVSRCRLYITMDGGPVHVSAAMKVPSVVVFPDEYFPFMIQKWHPWNVPYKIIKAPVLERMNMEERKIESLKVIDNIVLKAAEVYENRH